MGNSSKRRYDGKHRVTRILLSDYLLLKSISQAAGVSMAESLHKIITRDWAMTQSASRVKAPVALPVTAPVAYRSGPITAIATNGGKMPAFRIKARGVKYA